MLCEHYGKRSQESIVDSPGEGMWQSGLRGYLQLPVGSIVRRKVSTDADLDFRTVLVDGRFGSLPNDKIEIRYAVLNEYRQTQKQFLSKNDGNAIAREILKYWKKQKHSTDTQRWELLCFETSPNENSAKEISDFISRHIPRE